MQETRFRLASDVEFIATSSLSVDMQANLAAGDFVLSRTRTRAMSSLVSRSMRQFLELLVEPRSLTSAVLEYATKYRTLAETEAVLDNVADGLSELVRAGHLIRLHGSEDDADFRYPSQTHAFADWSVVSVLRSLDDSLVYQVRSNDGREGILKCALREKQATQLNAEYAILSGLKIDVVPPVLDRGLAPFPFIVLARIPGVTLDVVAHELRDQGAHSDLIALAVRVVDCYATLHENGVLHGDVHPGNVVVTAAHEPVLVDFGLAQRHGMPSDAYRTGGVSFYMAPESAEFMLSTSDWPAPTQASEQFSLGALIYELLSGTTYFAFTLERSAMLEQIRDPLPRPLTATAGSWTAQLDAVVQTALAREPNMRWPSVREFHKELVSKTLHAPTSRNHWRSDRARAREVMQALAESSLSYVKPEAPHASVSHGAAGVAYALYRLANVESRGDWLAFADLWATNIQFDEQAFTSRELDIDARKMGSASLLHGELGVYVVRSLVASAIGAHDEARVSIEHCLGLIGSPENLDWSVGLAGCLGACTVLLDGLRMYGVDLSAVQSHGERTAQRLAAELRRPSGVLGVAHGNAGVLLALLRWHRSTCSAGNEPLITAMRELAEFAIPYGRGLRFPVAAEAHPRFLPSWCNGSAGLAILFADAARQWPALEFASIAERFAYNGLDEPCNVSGLCCGRGGQAYSFLYVERVTHERRWRRAAEASCHNAWTLMGRQERPSSLFHGGPGLALLAYDVEADGGPGGGFPFIEW